MVPVARRRSLPPALSGKRSRPNPEPNIDYSAHKTTRESCKNRRTLTGCDYDWGSSSWAIWRREEAKRVSGQTDASQKPCNSSLLTVKRTRHRPDTGVEWRPRNTREASVNLPPSLRVQCTRQEKTQQKRTANNPTEWRQWKSSSQSPPFEPPFGLPIKLNNVCPDTNPVCFNSTGDFSSTYICIQH